jgi:hypothetical protein
LNARSFQHAFRQAFPFQGTPTKIRVQAIERILINVHHYHLMAAAEQMVT